MKDLKKTIEIIEKRLDAFKSAKEWSDFISLLTALDKPLKSLPAAFDLDLLPKNLIYKRLNQCLNPALPSGVHNKVIQTYSIIIDKFTSLIEDCDTEEKRNKCSDILFNTLMLGFFTFSAYTKIQTKHLYLDLIEQHLFKLRIDFNLYVRNIFLGLLPGLEEDSEISNKTNQVILKLMKLTNKNVFWSHFWEVFLSVSEQRICVINFFTKNESIINGLNDDKKQYILKNQDNGSNCPNKTCFYFLDERFVVYSIKSGLSDKQNIVVRGSLDLIKVLLPLEDLSYESKIDLLESIGFLYTYRDVGLNKRIDMIIDVDGSNIKKVKKRIDSYKIDEDNKPKKMISYDFLTLALERYIKEDENKLAVFYKILTVLEDKSEVCDYIAESLIVKSMFAMFKKRNDRTFEDVKRYFDNYCANTDVWFIWFCLFKSFYDLCNDHTLRDDPAIIEHAKAEKKQGQIYDEPQEKPHNDLNNNKQNDLNCCNPIAQEASNLDINGPIDPNTHEASDLNKNKHVEPNKDQPENLNTRKATDSNTKATSELAIQDHNDTKLNSFNHPNKQEPDVANKHKSKDHNVYESDITNAQKEICINSHGSILYDDKHSTLEVQHPDQNNKKDLDNPFYTKPDELDSRNDVTEAYLNSINNPDLNFKAQVEESNANELQLSDVNKHTVENSFASEDGAKNEDTANDTDHMHERNEAIENLVNEDTNKKQAMQSRINEFIEMLIFSIQNLEIIEKDILEIHLPFFVILVLKNQENVTLEKLVEFLCLCFSKIEVRNSANELESPAINLYSTNELNSPEKDLKSSAMNLKSSTNELNFDILIDYIKEFYNTEETKNVKTVLSSLNKSIAKKIIEMFSKYNNFIFNNEVLLCYVNHFSFKEVPKEFFINYFEMLISYEIKDSDKKTYNELLEDFCEYFKYLEGSKESKIIIEKSYDFYVLLLNTQNHIYLQKFNTIFKRKFETFMIYDFQSFKNIQSIFDFIKISVCESKDFYFYSVFICICNFFINAANEVLYTKNLYDRTDFIGLIDSLYSFDNIFSFIIHCIDFAGDDNTHTPDISKSLTAFTILKSLFKYSARFVTYLKTSTAKVHPVVTPALIDLDLSLAPESNTTIQKSIVPENSLHDTKQNTNTCNNTSSRLLLAVKMYNLATKDSYEVQIGSLEIINTLLKLKILHQKDLMKIDFTDFFTFLASNKNKDIFLNALRTLKILSDSENEECMANVIELLKPMSFIELNIYLILKFIFDLRNVEMRKTLLTHTFLTYSSIEYNEHILDNVFENRLLWTDDEMSRFIGIVYLRLEQEAKEIVTGAITTKSLYHANMKKKIINSLSVKLLDNEPKLFIKCVLNSNPNSEFLKSTKNYEKIQLLILLQQKIDFNFLIQFENNYDEDDIYNFIKNSENVVNNISTMPRNKIYNHEPLQWFLNACLRNDNVKGFKPLAFVKIIENSVFLLQKCTDPSIKRFRTLEERNKAAKDLFVSLSQTFTITQDSELRNSTQTYFMCLYNVLKNRNTEIYSSTLKIHAELSSNAFFDKFWHKSFVELFQDPKFFTDTADNMKAKIAIMKNYMVKNASKVTDYLGKIESSFFVSKDAEINMKTSTMRRIAFLFYCSEKNALNAYLNTTFERIVEYLTSPVPEVKKDAFMLAKIIIYKTEVKRLYIIWPTLFAEISIFLDRVLNDAITNYDLFILAEIIKTLEIIFVMQIDQVIEVKWKYLSPLMSFGHTKTIFNKIAEYCKLKNSLPSEELVDKHLEIPKSRIPYFRSKKFEKLKELHVFAANVEKYYKELDLLVTMIDENELMDLLKIEFYDD